MNPGPRHVFVPDHEVPADIGGRRFGACCALPEDNQAHSPPDRPPDDYSNRILGEHQDE